ncbi:MAG: helix-turn-helix domain-containing protein [Candidatus Peregrinibacteria bacterium]|nr:helix-turn-helix domain-containing protein [Candidatus Peregrinibacteria bacterium]
MDDLFSRFGLSTKETETFTKLLTLGAQPISVVAKHVGIPRSSMYFIVEKLKEHRLIEEFDRAGIKYVKCIPVKDIADVLKAEERNIKQTLLLLEEKLPTLQALESTLSVTPKVKFSEGKESVMKMYESLAQEKELYAFFNPETVQRMMPAYLNIIHEAVNEHGSSAKEIAVDCEEARTYKRKFDSTRHQIKILPRGATFLSDCIICRERICMISYGENQIAAVEIFSQTLASTQRTVFEQVWNSLK